MGRLLNYNQIFIIIIIIINNIIVYRMYICLDALATHNQHPLAKTTNCKLKIPHNDRYLLSVICYSLFIICTATFALCSPDNGYATHRLICYRCAYLPSQNPIAANINVFVCVCCPKWWELLQILIWRLLWSYNLCWYDRWNTIDTLCANQTTNQPINQPLIRFETTSVAEGKRRY